MCGLWIVVASCASAPTTSRQELDTTVVEGPGTGAVTSQDYRSVGQRMARSLIQIPQIGQAATPPKIAFLSVKNNSQEYIDMDAFLRKIRGVILRHSEGRVMFLDREHERALRDEQRKKQRGDYTSAAGPQTLYGADFFLTGTIDSIYREEVQARSSYLRYSFRLVEAATSAIVWEDEYEIKRLTTIPTYDR